MKNTSNTFNIIIPKKWESPLESSNKKDEILKNLKGISTEDIDSIWEEIDSWLEARKEERKKEEFQEIKDEEERCSEEHVLAIREFLLRLWFQLFDWDPLAFVKGKPVFIWTRWNKFFVFHDYDCICKDIDWLWCMKDEETDMYVNVINVEWKPTLVVKIWYEDIIIWGEDQIDAGIFFRNHEESGYTVKEIRQFLESLGQH
jgi:hypothetical protein